MSAVRERPRVAAALLIALVVLVALAMLAGGALAGDSDCARAKDGATHSRIVEGKASWNI